MVLPPAEVTNGGAVFDGFAEACLEGVGCERRRGRRRSDVRRESRVGPSVGAAAAGNGLDRAAAANEVSVARVGRPRRAPASTGQRDAGCDVGGAPGGAADHGGAQHGVAGPRSAEADGQKKRYTPTNSVALMSRPPGASGARRSRSAMRASTSSSTNRVRPRICYATTPAACGGRALGITRRAATGRRTRWSRRSAPRH